MLDNYASSIGPIGPALWVRCNARLANWGAAVFLLLVASGAPAMGASPNDPFYAEWQWNLQPDPFPDPLAPGVTYPNPATIDVEPAWQVAGRRPTLDQVVVAVVGTGAALSHPDLTNNVWTNPGETLNGIDDDGNGYLDDIHGIHISGGCRLPTSIPCDANEPASGSNAGRQGSALAGIIAAEADNEIEVAGIGRGVKVMPIRFQEDRMLFRDASLGSDYQPIFDMSEAIDYAVTMKRDHGVNVRVIQIAAKTYPIFSVQTRDDLERFLAPSIRAALDEGILVVTGAGDSAGVCCVSANDNDVRPVYPAAMGAPNPMRLEYPDGFPNVVSVTAVDLEGVLFPGFILGNGSGFGAQSVDIAALGDFVVSTANYFMPSEFDQPYEAFFGSDVAAAHVSGVAALAFAVDPTLTYADFISRMHATYRPLPGLDGKLISPGVINAAGVVVLACDTNLDGTVNRTDAAVLGQHYGTASGATMSMGDCNGDGAVDAIDLAMLQRRLELSAAPAPSSAAVPEPSSAPLVLVGAAVLLVASGRQRTQFLRYSRTLISAHRERNKP